VAVSSWGLRLPDGQTMMITEPFPLSSALPYRLGEGTSGSWYTDTLRVVETCKAHGVDYADPNPPEPSTRRPVYPGIIHSGISIRPLEGATSRLSGCPPSASRQTQTSIPSPDRLGGRPFSGSAGCVLHRGATALPTRLAIWPTAN
jgi:hypothetical protein